MDRGCFLSGESTVTLPLCMKRSARWDHSTVPAPLTIAGEGRVRRRGVTYDGVLCYFSLDDDALRASIYAAIDASGVACWPNPAWLVSVGDRRPLLARARAANILPHRIDVVGRDRLTATCLSFGGPCVVKVGNHHAGIGKYLVREQAEVDALLEDVVVDAAREEFFTVEPFFEGDSFRIVVAGETANEETICFRYDNPATWIKNAEGCEVVRAEAPDDAIEHAIHAHRLFQSVPGGADGICEGTALSGVDYVRDAAGAWHYLEWNGFPWLAGDPDVERLGTRVLGAAMAKIEQADPSRFAR